MADDKSLFARTGRSALADGAARFDTLARELKAQQVSQSQGPSSTGYQPQRVSPDEAWARNFMTQGIGPRLEPPNAASIAPTMQMQMANLRMSFDFAPPAAAVVSPAAGKPEALSAIGAGFGKPARRRSWLGRLLRPKS